MTGNGQQFSGSGPELRDLFRRNIAVYIPAMLRIIDKDRPVLIPFELNPPQIKFLRRFWQHYAVEQKPFHAIILKARKMGFSTLIEAILFWRTSLWPYMHALIMAHKPQAVQYIYNITKRFYDNLPTDDPYLKPKRKYSNKEELVFKDEKNPEWSLDSSITVGTGKMEDFGRSMTPRFIHMSEFAFFSDPEKMYLSVSQSVPQSDSTIFVIESTANGIGNTFYELWQQAKKGENDFIPFFFPWHEDPRNTNKIPGVEEDADLDKKIWMLEKVTGGVKFDTNQYKGEQELLDKGVTPEQLYWRRLNIRNKCQNNLDLFRQENPSTDEEAFLTSGIRVFNQQKLIIMLNNTGQIYEDRGEITQKGFEPSLSGSWTIYEHPEPGFSYVIGTDTAEGVEGRSYSCSVVLKKSIPLEVVAIYHDIEDPSIYAKKVAQAGYYYNTALINPEENAVGLATIGILKMLYKRFYMRKVAPSHVADKFQLKIGYRTTGRTKPLLLSAIAKEIEEDNLIIPDKNLIKELLAITNEDGDMKPEKGGHYDRVIALGLAIVAVDFVPYKKDEKQNQKSRIELEKELQKLNELLDEDPYNYTLIERYTSILTTLRTRFG